MDLVIIDCIIIDNLIIHRMIIDYMIIDSMITDDMISCNTTIYYMITDNKINYLMILIVWKFTNYPVIENVWSVIIKSI